MKKIKELISPCTDCFNKGIVYPNKKCENCEYNICIQIMKKMLYANDNCSLCKNRINLGGGYWDCKDNLQEKCGGEHYNIDWNTVSKEYDV